MDIYTDYANWKLENHDFISKLVAYKSVTISRFAAVISVVDYLYNKFLQKKQLSSDDETFFSVGFDYIYDNFYTIKTLLDYKFDGSYEKLEKCGKTINLLLYVNEFQAELLTNGIETKKLDEFEEKINQYLDKGENVPDAFFPMLNDIADPLFEKNGIEFNSIESIFYEVAVTYGIYKADDFDVYNAVFELQKNKKNQQE